MDEPARAEAASLTRQAPSKSHVWWTLAAFLFAGVCLFAWLGSWALIDPDEGRNASIALEMKTSGAWLVPTYDNLPYLDKPAFYFRAVALSFSLFGKSEAAARLPSAAFGFGLLVVVYLFCRCEYGWRTGALAVVILATTPMYVAFSRMVIFDMGLTLAVCSAIFSGYLGEQTSGSARRIWYATSAFAAAIATLIKGPVGFLVPLLVLLAFGFAEHRRGILRRIFSPVNLTIFFGIVLAWFFGVTLRRHDFPYYGIVLESLQRFTTQRFHRYGPFYYYLIIIAVLFFPWSMLLPEAVVSAWRTRRQLLPADRLLGIAAIMIVLFFSLSRSKLPEYILPGFVALGILVARLFSLAWERPGGLASRLVRRGTLLMACVSAVFAALLGADVYHRRYLLLALHVHSRDGLALQGLFAPTFWAFAAIAVLGLAAYSLRDARVAFAVFSLFMALWLTLGWKSVQAYAEVLSTRSLAARAALASGSADVVLLQCFPTGMPYYLGRPVYLVTADGRETTSNYVAYSLQSNPIWPPNVVPPGQFPAWLAQETHPVYVIARADRKAQLDSLASNSGAGVQEITPGWWGALLPPSRAH
ncbi:MAG: ArnT family glycosyltransferase [Candidatus Acidiferrales bacterium]